MLLIGEHAHKLRIAADLGVPETLNARTVKNIESAVRRRLAALPQALIEASGSLEGFAESLAVASPRGRVALTGYYEMRKTPTRPDDIHMKELQVVGTDGSAGAWPRAVELLARGLVKPSKLITHRFALTDYQRALRMASRDNRPYVKAVFFING